jgi:hypothetical protein
MRLRRLTLALIIGQLLGCGGGGEHGTPTPAGNWNVTLGGISYMTTLTQISCVPGVPSDFSCFASPEPQAGPGTVWPDQREACVHPVDWILVIEQTAPLTEQFLITIEGFDPMGMPGNDRVAQFGGTATLSSDGKTMQGPATPVYDNLGCGSATTFSAHR